MECHWREDPLTRELRTMCGCLSLEQCRFWYLSIEIQLFIFSICLFHIQNRYILTSYGTLHDFRWCLLFHICCLHLWGLLWFSWSSTFGLVSSQMHVLAYMGLFLWRYTYIIYSLFPFTYNMTLLCKGYRIAARIFGKSFCALILFLWIHEIGVLSSVRNVGFRFVVGKSFEARHIRDGCRTSLLLSNCASSSCWWKIHAQNSSMGVSFS